MLLWLDFNTNMGKVKKSTDVVDEVKDLFDLLKEGTSYILHIYLSFLSKIIPVDFIEKLFDDHKGKSSYNFSKSGKTYIYRLLNSIIELEKKLVAIGLQYLHTTIPLPFLKNIYENFCINNNLECTDVKLRKCKKALQCSNKSTTSKTQVNNQGTTQEDNTVSTPLQLSATKLPSETNNSKNNISDINVVTNNDSADPFKIVNTPSNNNQSISFPSIFGGSLKYKNSPSISVSVTSGYSHINSFQSTLTPELSATQVMPTKTPLLNREFPSNLVAHTNVFDSNISKTYSTSNSSSKSNELKNYSSVSSSKSNVVINDNGGKQVTQLVSKDISPHPLINSTNTTFENVDFNHVYTTGNSGAAVETQTKTVPSILTPIAISKPETDQSKNNPPSVSIEEPFLKPSKDFHDVKIGTTPSSSKLLPSITSVAPFNITLPSFDELPNPFTLPAPKTTVNSNFELPPISMPSFKPLPDVFNQSTPVTSTSSSNSNASASSFEPLPDPFSNSMFHFSENS